MKISVVVNIHNCESYIHKCIDSLLSQNYDDFELLLVDNGSTDKSKIICDEYTMKDLRVKSFHLDAFSSISNGFKRGIEEADGDYITFINGETFLDRHFLQRMAKALSIYNADFIFCDCIKYNGMRNVRIHTSQIENGAYEKDRIANEILPKMFFNITSPFSQIINTDYKAKIYSVNLIKKALVFFVENECCNWENLLTLYTLTLSCKTVYLKNEYLYYCKAPQSDINNYFSSAINYYNISKLIISGHKSADNTLNLFRLNIISDYIDLLTENIAKHNKKFIVNKLKEISDSELFTSTILNKDIYIPKKHKFFYILLKNKLYLLLYILIYFKKTNQRDL